MSEKIYKGIPVNNFKTWNSRKRALLASILAVVLLLILVIYRFFMGEDGLAIHLDAQDSAPSWEHHFGTD